MAEKKYPHEGHRDRVRERFMHVGFDNMTEQEIVEMLLFYAIPRKDTNDTAHMLLSNFGFPPSAAGKVWERLFPLP